MRIIDWSSDVCSSDLGCRPLLAASSPAEHHPPPSHPRAHRGSCLDAPRLQRIEPMTKDLSYPLHWPASWPRARGRSEAKFGQKDYSKAYQTTKRVTIATALDRLEAELTRLGARGIILSSNLERTLSGAPRRDRKSPRLNPSP